MEKNLEEVSDAELKAILPMMEADRDELRAVVCTARSHGGMRNTKRVQQWEKNLSLYNEAISYINERIAEEF